MSPESKILSFETLKETLHNWREKKQSIVFTNGCFDLLHKGHISYLFEASKLADHLLIGLNSDASVKTLEKGDLRPIKDQETRAIILASLYFVSAVVVFNESTPYELIKMVQPNVLVKGGDWKPEQIVGGDVVQNLGGKVLSIPFIPGHSTTSIVEKIKAGK